MIFHKQFLMTDWFFEKFYFILNFQLSEWKFGHYSIIFDFYYFGPFCLAVNNEP